MPLYKDLGYAELKLPNAVRASQHVLSLPVHPGLSAEDVELVAEEFVKAVRA